MTSPDSWVRSAYSVFWSRPGSGSPDYQPLGATRRPRPRRLRGWQPLAAVLVVAVLGFSTLGLVVHRPGASLGVNRSSSGVRTALGREGEGPETAPEAARTVAGGGEESEGQEVPAEENEQEQGESRPAASGGSAPQETAAEMTPPQPQPPPPPPPPPPQQQQQQQQPKETLVVLRPVGVAEPDLDASGNGVSVQGD